MFDRITPDDIIMAFFPCIYFCQASKVQMTYSNTNTRKLDYRGKTEKILERSRNRQYFYELIIKLFCITHERGLRMIVENPYSGLHYLLNENFVEPPTMIDRNRLLRGDFFKKPTMYWFVNCNPTNGLTIQRDKEQKLIQKAKKGIAAGICSEERSMISQDYARNFICDFLLGKEQTNTQLSLF